MGCKGVDGVISSNEPPYGGKKCCLNVKQSYNQISVIEALLLAIEDCETLFKDMTVISHLSSYEQILLPWTSLDGVNETKPTFCSSSR